MTAALTSLLQNVFDYAGLFPPAGLDMAASVERYFSHQSGPEKSLMARFVCSSARLEEFRLILGNDRSHAVPLSVVGRASATYDEWQSALEADAKAMTDFIAKSGDSAWIEAYEVRIPSHEDAVACFRDLNAFNQVDVFVELPWGPGLDDSLAKLAETEWLFAKVRTGGLSAESYPSEEQIAAFIQDACSLEVPFKMTAGLHHPLPATDSANGARMHGFLNVLTATCLTYVHDLNRTEIAEILFERSQENWKLSDDGLRWRGYEASIDDIEECRDLMLGIGSCSIEEPVQDLTVLGLYP